MKSLFCITALVLVTFTHGAPANGPMAIHRNGIPPATAPYPVDPATGYYVMPATIPQPPPQSQAAAKKNDVLAYLANVPVVGNALAQSSPQALEYVGKAMPAALELPEVD